MLRPASTTNSIGQLSSRNRKTGANYNKQNLRRGQTGSILQSDLNIFALWDHLCYFLHVLVSSIVSARCDCPGTQGPGLGSARKQKKIEVQAEQKIPIKVQVSTKHLLFDPKTTLFIAKYSASGPYSDLNSSNLFLVDNL